MKILIKDLMERDPCRPRIDAHLERLDLPFRKESYDAKLHGSIEIDIYEYLTTAFPEPDAFDCSTDSGNVGYKQEYLELFEDLNWFKPLEWYNEGIKSLYCSVQVARYLTRIRSLRRQGKI